MNINTEGSEWIRKRQQILLNKEISELKLQPGGFTYVVFFPPVFSRVQMWLVSFGSVIWSYLRCRDVKKIRATFSSSYSSHRLAQPIEHEEKTNHVLKNIKQEMSGDTNRYYLLFLSYLLANHWSPKIDSTDVSQTNWSNAMYVNHTTHVDWSTL